MELLKKSKRFLKQSMSNMSTSDRISASREAKALVLGINEIYKKSKDPNLMNVMKLITLKKRKIDKRLRGHLTA